MPSTPDLFINTSLEPPILPRAQPQSTTQYEHQLEELVDEDIAARLEAQATERQIVLHVAEASRQADEADDILREVRQRKCVVLQRFEQALKRFESDDKEAHDAFYKHCLNAFLVTSADVRSFDIVRWYRDLPEDLSNALFEVCFWEHSEAKTRVNMDNFQQQAGLVEMDIVQEERYAAARYGQPDFRFEVTSKRQQGLDVFDSQGQGERMIQNIIANLQVRMVRLQYAESNLRYQYNKWEKTLDYTFSLYLYNVRQYLIANPPPASVINSPIYTRMKIKFREFYDLIAIRQAKLKSLKEEKRRHKQALEEKDRQIVMGAANFVELEQDVVDHGIAIFDLEHKIREAAKDGVWAGEVKEIKDVATPVREQESDGSAGMIDGSTGGEEVVPA